MLVEESCGPDGQLAVGSQHGSSNPHLKPVPLEEVNDHPVRGQDAVSHSEAYTVQHMIAVGLQNHLGTARNRTGSQFCQRSLTGGVQVCLWILDDDKVIGSTWGTVLRSVLRSQQGNDRRESTAHAKTYVPGPKGDTGYIVGSGVSEGCDRLIGIGHHVDLQLRAWTDDA